MAEECGEWFERDAGDRRLGTCTIWVLNLKGVGAALREYFAKALRSLSSVMKELD